MTNPEETVHAFRLLRNSTTKATDHELQKYDNFTRYGHWLIEMSLSRWNDCHYLRQYTDSPGLNFMLRCTIWMV
ncbi:hypothetical protein V1293_000726 [Bradyrhizobium sp. AZCC 1693]